MMSKEDILRRLRLLGSELEAVGAAGELLLAGGASMCLVHEARDATMDVDAVFEPRETIASIVGRIAASEGLPENWLNDSVGNFVGPDAPRDFFLSLPGLEVYSVSAEYLLAMKLMAARDEPDLDDVVFLMRKLGRTARESVSEVLLTYFDASTIRKASWMMLDYAVDFISKTK